MQTVLLTVDAVGGVWSYALTLARALSVRGVRTVLASMGPRPTAAQRTAARQVPALTLEESDFRLEWMDRAFDPEAGDDVARAGEWLLALERRHAPDVVHVNGYAHAALPFRAPVLLVAHSSVCTWFRAVKATCAPPSFDRYRASVRAGLTRAQLVVAPTRAMLDSLLEDHAGVAPRTRVIPNAADEAAALAVEREPRILACGRLWDEAKNLRALDSIAAQLPWPVRVAGSTRSPDGRVLTSANASLLGALDADDMQRELASASIFVHPARYEPFGLAPLEAARAGCALVVGDIASLREVWGDAAVFVDPDDPAALFRALRTLTDDAGRRSAWAQRAYARAKHFTPARMVESYLAAYRDVAPQAGFEAARGPSHGVHEGASAEQRTEVSSCA